MSEFTTTNVTGYFHWSWNDQLLATIPSQTAIVLIQLNLLYIIVYLYTFHLSINMLNGKQQQNVLASVSIFLLNVRPVYSTVPNVC